MANMGTLRLPAAPLLNEIERLGGVTGTLEMARLPVRTERNGKSDCSAEYITLDSAVGRAEARGWFFVFHVDELCVRFLLRHPCEIYGPLWFEGPDDEVLQKRLAAMPDPFSRGKGAKKKTGGEAA